MFEDVHWAEPKLLDLVEHLGERVSGPILAFSITRPELLEHRPSWRDGSVWLRPLPEQHSAALVASLPGGAASSQLPARASRDRGGKPALRRGASRLRRGAGPEGDRRCPAIGRSATRQPSRPAPAKGSRRPRTSGGGRPGVLARCVVALSPPDTEVSACSSSRSCGTGSIRPTPASRQEEHFRFHHVLVRDVAYAGLPKAQRADVHERYADWLEEHQEAPDEIVGYHLEQAYGYRQQLAPLDEQSLALAARAATSSGWHRGRLAARRHVRSAKLQERAVSLLANQSGASPRPFSSDSLACSNSLNEHARADELSSEVLQAARTAGDTGLELFALIVKTEARSRQSGVDQYGVDLPDGQYRSSLSRPAASSRSSVAPSLLLLRAKRSGGRGRACRGAPDRVRSRQAWRTSDTRCPGLGGGSRSYSRCGGVSDLRRADLTLRRELADSSRNPWSARVLRAMVGSFIEARELIATARSLHEELDCQRGFAGGGG